MDGDNVSYTVHGTRRNSMSNMRIVWNTSNLSRAVTRDFLLNLAVKCPLAAGLIFKAAFKNRTILTCFVNG